MRDPQFVNLKLAVASPSLLASSFPQRNFTSSEPTGVPETTQAEWAAEAIVSLRHVVAGISCALLLEAAVAFAIFATWNLWHIR